MPLRPLGISPRTLGMSLAQQEHPAAWLMWDPPNSLRNHPTTDRYLQQKLPIQTSHNLFYPAEIQFSSHTKKDKSVRIRHSNYTQWPFQEPKLEVPAIYKAQISDHIPPNDGQTYGNHMVLRYLHFRIQEFPLIHPLWKLPQLPAAPAVVPPPGAPWVCWCGRSTPRSPGRSATAPWQCGITHQNWGGVLRGYPNGWMVYTRKIRLKYGQSQMLHGLYLPTFKILPPRKAQM